MNRAVSIRRFVLPFFTFCILHSAFCILSSSAVPLSSLEPIAEGIQRLTLDNGLIGLVKEDHTAPMVALQIWVGTGSAQEGRYLGGGLSHFVEHMIFKGTPTRPGPKITQAIDDCGGSINAYTALDRTVFLVDIPSRHWPTGLAVLADAVRNASFPADEWQREKDVILREMAMNKDDPARELSNLLWTTAYRIHPYRYPVIGCEEIFKNLTRDDLLAFFRQNYTPDNMIVVIAGDISAAAAETALRREFAGFPRRAGGREFLTPEPEQIAGRQARRTGPYEVARLELAWHTVALHHPDAPALDVLALIVGQGRSSRLVREIKEKRQLAHAIDASSFTPNDPGLFGISAVYDPTNEPALLQAIAAEVRRWQETPFQEIEIEKARRSLLTGTLSALQTMHGQADQLASGEFYAGSPRFFLTYLQRLEAVTPEALAAVARRYLRPENQTLAILAPAASLNGKSEIRILKFETNSKFQGSNVPNFSVSNSFVLNFWFGSFDIISDFALRYSNLRACAPPEQALVMPTVHKQILSNGLTLLTREDQRLPLVCIAAVGGGGLLYETATNNGLTALMADLLTRGTKRRTADEIAETAERLGGSLTAFAGQNSFGLRAECLREDAVTFMDLLADCLLHPAFTPAELEKQRAVQLAAIAQQQESPFFIAQEALRQTLFPDHPYRFTPEGRPDSVRRLRREDLLTYHARMVVNSNIVLAVFGAITEADARKLAEQSLKKFPAGPRPDRSGAPTPPKLPAETRRTAPRVQTILLMGFPGVTVADPRLEALNVLQDALSGLSSDLLTVIREQQGLAYYAGAYQKPGVDPGLFALYAGIQESALDHVQALMAKEIRRLTTEGLRPEEFERARQKLLANYQKRLQLNGDLALECALNELYGLGYGYGFELEQRLASLTPERVREAAASVLNTNALAVAIVTPADGPTK